MKTWFAYYSHSSTAEPVEATVLAVQDHLSIGWRNEDGHTTTTRWEMRDVNASFHPGEQSTKLVNARAGGGKLVIENKQAFEFIRDMQAENNKPWHQKGRTKDGARNLVIFFCIAAVLVTAYFLVVPWLSEKFASTISVKREAEFGEAVFKALDLAAQQDPQATMLVNEFFNEMKVSTPYNIRITVVKGDVVNAFALPGGNIVVYSALLEQLESYPELAALLSHEFTHVNNRHSTKSVFRQLGSRVFLGLLFGKFGSVTSVLVDQADRFKSLKYSRRLEKEADLDGLNILKERKIDTEGFVQLFRHLKASARSSAMPEFLTSHPDIDKRVAYIRDASANQSAIEHSGLKTIFEKIKQIK